MLYMWHVSYYLYHDYAVSFTRLSDQLHICSKQYGKMCSSKQPLEIKTKAFLYFSGMDST